MGLWERLRGPSVLFVGLLKEPGFLRDYRAASVRGSFVGMVSSGDFWGSIVGLSGTLHMSQTA